MRFYFYLTLLYLFFVSTLPHEHRSQAIHIPFTKRYSEQVKVFSKITYFPQFIALIVRFSGTKSGEYQVPSMSSFFGTLKSISSNRVLYRLFVPEGSSSEEIVSILNNSTFLAGRLDQIPMNGTLMPSTYLVPINTRRQLILGYMQKLAIKKQESIWETRPKDYAFTRDEWIIIASILEKEGLDFVDKQKICGVIMNRLKKKMKLQIDATVLFVKTSGLYSQRLTWHDLNSQSHLSSYNTYRNYGLPPGPISNPGVESLKAALCPIKHNFLYYRISKGSHIFNESFAQHKRCVHKKPCMVTKSSMAREYLLNGKN